MLETIKDFILDVLFPKQCVSCGAADTVLCSRCLASLKPSFISRCHVCEKNTVAFRTHERCRQKSSLDGLFYVGSFSDPILRSVIKSWKYQFIRDLEFPLETMINSFLLSHVSIFPRQAVAVPIPLHPKRLAWRGFNQAAVVALKVGKGLDFKMEEFLVRTRNTKPQAELTEKEKSDNVFEAFSVIDKNNVQDKTIIIVDDCYTTGATMGETAAVLKKVGAKEVWGFVLAKG